MDGNTLSTLAKPFSVERFGTSPIVRDVIDRPQGNCGL